jgi:hypothetical protein
LAPSAVGSLIRIACSVVVATVVAEVLRQILPFEGSRLHALVVVAVAGGGGLLVYGSTLLLVERRVIAQARWPFAQLRSRLETRA